MRSTVKAPAVSTITFSTIKPLKPITIKPLLFLLFLFFRHMSYYRFFRPIINTPRWISAVVVSLPLLLLLFFINVVGATLHVMPFPLKNAVSASLYCACACTLL